MRVEVLRALRAGLGAELRAVAPKAQPDTSAFPEQRDTEEASPQERRQAVLAAIMAVKTWLLMFYTCEIDGIEHEMCRSDPLAIRTTNCSRSDAERWK